MHNKPQHKRHTRNNKRGHSRNTAQRNNCKTRRGKMGGHLRHTSKKHRTQKRNRVVVGKIHAKWCGHCIALVPEWNKMRVALARKSNPHKTYFEFVDIEQSEMEEKLPKVNETHLSNSDKKVELQGGFPTIFRIQNGKLDYYEGERTHTSLYKWFMEAAGGTEHRTHPKVYV
jgi:hypothetical protein